MCSSRCEKLALSRCLSWQISLGVSCHQLQRILWFRVLPLPGCFLHSSVTSLLHVLFGRDCSCSLFPKRVNRLFRLKQNAQLLLFFKNKFIYLIYFMPVLGLCCCVRASHCRGFSCCGARALGLQASVVVACGLQSAGSVVVAHRLSCSAACGIFPVQGLNPCPLHWQADSFFFFQNNMHLLFQFLWVKSPGMVQLGFLLGVSQV